MSALQLSGTTPAPNNAVEEDYVRDGDDHETWIGHTVLLVGHASRAGCEWAVLQDGDHTTPRYVAVPYDCGLHGGRSLWDALVATYWIA